MSASERNVGLSSTTGGTGDPGCFEAKFRIQILVGIQILFEEGIEKKKGSNDLKWKENAPDMKNANMDKSNVGKHLT